MARKKKTRAGRAETSDQPPASDRPNPTTTSPSSSVATGGTATASLLPSSVLPSAPPTTATTTQPVLSAPIPPPSLPLAIATNQPSPGFPPLSSQETHQEHISGTSVGPSATVLLAVTEDFMFRAIPNFVSTMVAMEQLRKMLPEDTDPQLRRMELDTLLGINEEEMKAVSDFIADMEELKGATEELVTQLEEKMKRDIESGGSKREGGGPDSGSGGGDGQGGGVCV